MNGMFEKAARKKLRFKTSKGLVSTEDLWDIPLISKGNAVSLDEIAKELYRQLKKENVESFVLKKTESGDDAQLQFDIVKHIIDVKLDNIERAKKAKETKEKKQRLLSIIAEKEDQGLKDMSLADLRKMAEEL